MFDNEGLAEGKKAIFGEALDGDVVQRNRTISGNYKSTFRRKNAARPSCQFVDSSTCWRLPCNSLSIAAITLNIFSKFSKLNSSGWFIT